MEPRRTLSSLTKVNGASVDGAGVELARVVLRWLHLMATAAWVGGSLVYLVVIRPTLRTSDAPVETRSAVAREFGHVVRLAIPALLISGMLLTLDRLADGRGNALYAGLLALKISTALVMFVLAWEFGRPRRHRRPGDGRGLLILALGALILFLAPLLRTVYGT